MNYIYDSVSNKQLIKSIQTFKPNTVAVIILRMLIPVMDSSVREYDPNDFYLIRDSLVVFYQKYALSPGAAGPIIYEIPHDR